VMLVKICQVVGWTCISNKASLTMTPQCGSVTPWCGRSGIRTLSSIQHANLTC
jgi:hypothetical protein